MTIEIDGGEGEGGGQIIRTSIGLSCALGRRVRIYNIRKGRKKPGLRAQHLAGVRLAGEMCDADITGLEIGSTEIDFAPTSNTGGAFQIDVGTAGSTSLVIQTCLIPALFANGPTELVIRGGTDVPWSPPIDYFSIVLMPLLEKMGVGAEIAVKQRGFYPSGGGEVQINVSSCRPKSADFVERGDLLQIIGSAAMRNLPDHVGNRAIDSVIKALSKYPAPEFQVDSAKGPSTGLSVVLAAQYEDTVLGASSLGEKGVPAEKVGETAARGLDEEMGSGTVLDMHATDQVIPFMFLAEGGSSFVTESLSLHAETNIRVCERFIRREVRRERKGRLTLISIT